MRAKKVIGYTLAIVGVGVLVWSAFVGLGPKVLTAIAAVAGLLLWVIGAGLVSMAAKEEGSA